MINIITGRCGSGKSRFVCDAVVREIHSGKRDVVLIVPEQQTVVWETKMASLLPPSANLRIEITNFTRLANSVFREYGGLADSVVDEGTRSLLIWRAMLTVRDQLEVYASSSSDIAKDAARDDKNIPHLLAAVDELKNSGISPSDAEKALAALTKDRSDSQKGGLAARLSDAVLVYAAYQTFLHEEYIDRGDLLDNLAAALAEHKYFSGKAVFIDSFFSLTRAEEKILSHIIRQADDVTVTFTCPAEEDTAPAKESAPDQISMFPEDDGEQQNSRSVDAAFAETEKYRRAVLSSAARWGKDVMRISLTKNHRHSTSHELRAVERFLFDYTSPLPEQTKCSHDVSVITCADVYDEAEACASIIDRLVREGYRYSDIAVVARNMKTREGIVDRVLRRHGIRCFMSESGDAASLPAVRLVTSALAVAANGWQRKDIIALLKTGMTSVGRKTVPAADFAEPEKSEFFEEAVGQLEDPVENCSSSDIINESLEGDIFELYTETWNIRGRKAYTEGPWNMNPAGYRIERTEEGNAMLRAANRAREKLILPLDRFLSVFDSGEASVYDIAEKIVYYAEECGMEEALNDAADAYRRLGMDADAEKVLQSWNKVTAILDCMVKNLGDSKLSAGRFAGLFSRIAVSTDVGTIPTGVDEVLLGSSSGLRTDSVKCVIMLGCMDGEFPGTVSDSGAFFSERDKITLEGAGLNIASPDLSIRAAREMFMFYRTASSASEKLFVLSPSTDESLLSEGAARIRAITESVRGSSCLRKFADMPISETVFTKSTAEYLFSRRPDRSERTLLRAVSDGREVPVQESNTADTDERVAHAQMLLTGRTAELIQDNRAPRMNLSQSKIETFVRCPFSYWSRYEMKLAPNPTAEIKAPDIGTFIHSVLERFFAETASETLPLPRHRTEQIADSIIEDYIGALARSGPSSAAQNQSLSNGRLEYLFLRLRRHVLVFLDAVMHELEQSEFCPAAFEVPIGIPSKNGKTIEAMAVPTDYGIDAVIRGIADRADVYTAPDGKKYLRIVDYKTGAKSFSLDDVKNGMHVQMLIYLFSLKHHAEKKGTPLTPAGAVYLQARPASISNSVEPTPTEAAEIAEDHVERSGVYLNDEAVLRAMDSCLDGKYVGVKQKSDGSLKSSRDTFLLSAEEFGSLENELREVIGKIGTRMLSGEACASPSSIGGKDPCEWCESRMICRHTKDK